MTMDAIAIPYVMVIQPLFDDACRIEVHVRGVCVRLD